MVRYRWCECHELSFTGEIYSWRASSWYTDISKPSGRLSWQDELKVKSFASLKFGMWHLDIFNTEDTISPPEIEFMFLLKYAHTHLCSSLPNAICKQFSPLIKLKLMNRFRNWWYVHLVLASELSPKKHRTLDNLATSFKMLKVVIWLVLRSLVFTRSIIRFKDKIDSLNWG